MNAPLSDETTARLLAEAMHAEVDTVLPPATLVSGLAARTAHRRRVQLAAVGVAASITVVAAVSAVAATRPDPVRPAGVPSATPEPSETATPSAAPEPITPWPRMQARSLPPGFRYWNTGHAATNPEHSDGWPLVVTYTRGFTYGGRPRTPIAITTSNKALSAIEVEDFTDTDPDARWVRVGSRRVVRAVGPSGTVGYHWTEQPGVNVSVTAARGVTDEEVRHVVAAAHLVTPVRPTSLALEPHEGTGVVLEEVRGRGSRVIGPFVVPAEFDVHIMCNGSRLRVQTGSLRDLTLGCTDPDTYMVQVVDHTNGVRAVTLRLTADQSTTWAVLVTVSGGHP